MKKTSAKFLPVLFIFSLLIFAGCQRQTPDEVSEEVSESDTIEAEPTEETVTGTFGDILPDEENPEIEVTTTPQPSQTPLASTDPLMEPRVYDEGAGFVLEYPKILIPDERVLDFVVFARGSDLNTPQAGITMDARREGNYTSYQGAISATESNLTDIKRESLENGIRISGTVASGYGQGMKIHTALFKYGQGALVFQTIDNEFYNPLFDQLIRTVEFD